MPPSVPERLASLAEPVRLRTLRLIAREELGVGEIARVLQLPQSTVSRHLQILGEAGWLDRRRDAARSLVRLADPLPDDARTLWLAVSQVLEQDDTWAEDDRRMVTVLAEREDGRGFFGRVAAGWDQVRTELFGAGFWIPTLMAALPRDLVVADLGCGTGEALAAFAPWVRRVIGVDREPAMLEAARARLGGHETVDLREGVLEELPLRDGEVDVATCMLALLHVDQPERVISEMARVIKPGGRGIILDVIDHDRREYRHLMGHRHLGFPPEQLARWMTNAGFRDVRVRPLPPATEAAGPGLVLATGDRADD